MSDRETAGAGREESFPARRQMSVVEEPTGSAFRESVPSQEDTSFAERRAAEKKIEAQERAEYCEEVDLFLEMWSNVADAWSNETLTRIVQRARLQAEAEKLLLNRKAGV